MSGVHLVTGRRATEISESVERAVESGGLRPGDRLPTVRALAADLDVSPTTVASAYRSLRDRGVIRTHGRGGTRIAGRPPLEGSDVTWDLPDGTRDLAALEADPQLVPRVRSAGSPRRLALERHEDLHDLVELVRKDLVTDRVGAESVALAPGGTAALAQVLVGGVRPGDRVVVEDPTPPAVAGVVAAVGLTAVRVGVDERGPVPGRLERALRSRPSAAVLTTRAHDVTGAAVDEERAAELDRVTGAHPAVLLITRDPLGAVAGAACHGPGPDGASRWAFIRDLGPAWGPDLGGAAVSGDELTVARLRGRQRLAGGHLPAHVQALLAELMEAPDSQRTVALAARTYSSRRITFLAELRRRGFSTAAPSGGTLWLPTVDEARAAEELLGRGFAVATTRARGWSSRPGLRICTTRLSSAEADRLADDLLEVLARA